MHHIHTPSKDNILLFNTTSEHNSTKINGSVSLHPKFETNIQPNHSSHLKYTKKIIDFCFYRIFSSIFVHFIRSLNTVSAKRRRKKKIIIWLSITTKYYRENLKGKYTLTTACQFSSSWMFKHLFLVITWNKIFNL